ncbi:WhiB family transcriptional regulator [Rhodococcus yananensis]|uniref:WhiB family transcriptional regulator n=1 Tax=Rhodococcus yananensis TaxID=2879464 RepID=UPI001CF8D7D1
MLPVSGEENGPQSDCGVPCDRHGLASREHPVQTEFCRECPVSAECLEQALRHDDRWGVVASNSRRGSISAQNPIGHTVARTTCCNEGGE